MKEEINNSSKDADLIETSHNKVCRHNPYFDD